MFCIAPVNVIVTSHAYRFEIIRVKSPAWVVLVRDDVMHKCRPVYRAPGSGLQLLSAFLAFIVVALKDVCRHLSPCCAVVES